MLHMHRGIVFVAPAEEADDVVVQFPD
jgi:hypothetical protein